MNTTPLSFRPIQVNNPNFFKIGISPVLYFYPNPSEMPSFYPGRKTLVNCNTTEGISIVNDNFLPVPHEKAFEFGVHLFELLFGVTPQIHKEVLHQNKTDYNVDFISEQCKIIFDSHGYRFVNHATDLEGNAIGNILDVEEPQLIETASFPQTSIPEGFYDEYFPFLRVSNYLREGHSFYIELGYYRYRCSNGMMLGRKTRMTFRHRYHVSSFEIIAHLAVTHFMKYKNGFLKMAERIWRLLSIPATPAQMHQIVFHVFKDELMHRSIKERERIQQQIYQLTEKYIQELGTNLNSALNIATELSRIFEDNRVSNSRVQNIATVWINRITRKNFDISAYLEEIKDIEHFVMTAKENVIQFADENEW